MPSCKRCRTYGEPKVWPRYARNGRFRVLCRACDSQAQERQQRNESAHAKGYACYGRTPEYKREQRRKAAEAAGRDFVPSTEREQIKARVAIEKQARLKRSKAFRSFLSECAAVAKRQRKADSVRARYARIAQQERARVSEYKRKHADRNREWGRVRMQREREQSDGTATPEAIAAAKAAATECHYCGEAFSDGKQKQTDHVIPIHDGGLHSMSNIVIACARCNGAKAKLSPERWLQRMALEKAS